jgi:hypothetical protein
VYNSDIIIIVLFNLTESVKFTNALHYASKNVAKYLWLDSNLVELKCRSFSVILIDMLTFVTVIWNGKFCCQILSRMLLKLAFFCMT